LLFGKLIETYNDITAVIGLNDLVAIGAMSEAKKRGYSVPDDISFVGIDGIELASLISPKLTTYWSNPVQLGKKAFEILYNMVEKNEITTFSHSMIFQEGESVKQI